MCISMCSGNESECSCLNVATLFSTASRSFLSVSNSCVKNSVVSVARSVLALTFSSKNKVTISLATLCAISGRSYSKPTLKANAALPPPLTSAFKIVTNILARISSINVEVVSESIFLGYRLYF